VTSCTMPAGRALVVMGDVMSYCGWRIDGTSVWEPDPLGNGLVRPADSAGVGGIGGPAGAVEARGMRDRSVR
jgi:hypothetical protein